MKRFISVFLVIIMSAFMLSPTAVAQGDSALRFDENGNFRIMVIADTQDTAKPRREALDLINSALDTEKPDLVVLTGDNIAGYDISLKSEEKVKKAIELIMEPIVSRNIPFAIVFGNHDDEGGVSKEFQMGVYKSLKGCLATEGEEMTGCGNYNLTIKAFDSDRDLYNLWFIDSGTYNTDSEKNSYYAFVADDQIKWYESKSEELKAQNGGTPLPSMLFQHMPVTEIYELLKEVPKGTENAISKNGKYYVLDSEKAQGKLREYPCPPDYNNGQFGSWVKQGDIKAAFFGHDHINDFIGNIDGIDLVHTPGAGFFSYGNGYEHGVRIIDIKSDQSYTTKTVYYKDLVGTAVYGGEKLWDRGQGYYQSLYRTLGAVVGAVVLLGALSAVGIIIYRKKKGKGKK